MKLNTRNYQAGIDLGTTNSAIALVDHNGIKLLEVERSEVLLPSYVFHHEKDGYLTGIAAKNNWVLDGENGHKYFKGMMGEDNPFPIKNLRENFMAEELSGIILKKLEEVYRRTMGEQLHTVVVTVPERFSAKAIDATKIAAMGNYRMNGFSRITPLKPSTHYANFLNVEILMEPIAASLAYGMTKNISENGSW